MRFAWIVLLLIYPVVAGADDAEIAKRLKAKGAEVTESKGVVTALSIRDGSKWTEVNAPDYGNRLFQLVTLAIDPQKTEGAAQLTGSENFLNHYRFTNANTGAVHEVWVAQKDSHVARMKIGERTELTITP